MRNLHQIRYSNVFGMTSEAEKGWLRRDTKSSELSKNQKFILFTCIKNIWKWEKIVTHTA